MIWATLGMVWATYGQHFLARHPYAKDQLTRRSAEFRIFVSSHSKEQNTATVYHRIRSL